MMYLVLGILFIILGAIMVIKPQWIFALTEAWKSYSTGEPSDRYLVSTRIGGVFYILIGIYAIIFL